jgi:putative phosphoribosyl transferase
MRFHDRTDAGRQLASLLTVHSWRQRGAPLSDRDAAVVLALPRGGVPVAVEVARALRAPLDVFVVRKLGVPGHPELAMGAIASGGVQVLDQDLIEELDIPRALIEQATVRERLELERRDRLYHRDRPMPVLISRTVIVIDDGLATGSTMEAAVSALRQHNPSRIVVAVPVGAPEACLRLQKVADDVVCAHTPTPFEAVGRWYERFDQVDDDEVIDWLERSSPRS